MIRKINLWQFCMVIVLVVASAQFGRAEYNGHAGKGAEAPREVRITRMQAWERRSQNPHLIGAEGRTYTFRNRGEDHWKCEKAKTKSSIVIEAEEGIRVEGLREWCDRSEAPQELVEDLADLFSYQIDFLTDVKEGDFFSIYFQKWFEEGGRSETEPLLAARVVTGGEEHLAFYYELPEGYAGYFDEAGWTLERLFLKSPLNYRRITSRFTYRRLHPILKIYRPHLGIDYAAPEGTPVSAIGDGTVTLRGWKKGFGRYVELKHRLGYTSAYGHLSKYEKGLRKGKRVQAGDILGYVGESGLATGPHLDFRLYRGGRPVNFLKLDFPAKRRVPLSSWLDFFRKYEFYLSALRTE